jgi:pimeloyl-ACP methyl ester carboxylesterase
VSFDQVSRRELLALGAAIAVADAPAAARTAQPAPETITLSVERGFLRLSEGLVHYRSSGTRASSTRPALYMAHAGPLSSRSFAPMLPLLGETRFAFAPDMLGNGDSAPPSAAATDMSYYVDCAVRVLDALKLERVDFYGSHTGAQIACQLAVMHPQRVRRVILDGIPLFPEEFREQLLARYAPAVSPDEFGGHLQWAWNFVRDQSQFWPYFDRQGANRLANGVPSPQALHADVTDVLKNLGTYHIAYRAAFAQNVAALLPQLRCPVLLMASEHDPLSRYLDEAASLVRGAATLRLPRTAQPTDRAQAIAAFLDS